MAERGAVPNVHPVRRKALRAVRSLFTPLLPDDYLELINPLWSTRELRGRIEEIRPETGDAATIVIRPGFAWEGHEPGQYLRVGVVVDGIFHWRAYSITSDPGREDGCIAITPKLVPEGKVSPHFVRQAQPGTVVRLGGVEGDFTLPDPLPEKLLFISAGSGVTPIMSMLRCLHRRDEIRDVVVLHSARTTDDVIFDDQLHRLDEAHEGLRLHLQITKEQGRMGPEDLDDLCPDWREREAFVSGPSDMLDGLIEHWEAHGDRERLNLERFQPKGGGSEEGKGGTVTFLKSDCTTECDGSQPILEAGEEAGLELEHGCRMGICHTCVGKLTSGEIRDMRTGEITKADGQTVRICITTAEGDVEIEL